MKGLPEALPVRTFKAGVISDQDCLGRYRWRVSAYDGSYVEISSISYAAYELAKDAGDDRAYILNVSGGPIH